MSELLLQTIVEKLQSMEQLLKQSRTGKDEEALKGILEEIKKLSVATCSIDKLNELKLGIDECRIRLEHPLQKPGYSQTPLAQGDVDFPCVIFCLYAFLMAMDKCHE